MNQNRVNIIGASGSGKTTLGKALSERLDISFFDSDFYFHEPTDPPYQRQRSPRSRHLLITKDLKSNNSWVLSGAVTNWEPKPQLNYTLIVFLLLPPELRIQRLINREQILYGDRIKAGGDMEDEHRLFVDWTRGYDDNSCEGTNTYDHHEDFFNKSSCKTLKIERPHIY